MQDDFCFVQFLLHFHYTISIPRVLISCDIIAQLRKGHLFARVLIRVFFCKFIQNLCQKGESNTGGVLFITNNHSTEVVHSAVNMGNPSFVLYTLSGARLCSFSNRFTEKRHELLDAQTLEETEAGEVRF
eukprot:Lithocolla_globosa_v1_NODE_10277_length_615_cov_18.437500.p2 type:complete len:130 gc:universal NODE_10277_length_615_cov_18.437500:126-515(+)